MHFVRKTGWMLSLHGRSSLNFMDGWERESKQRENGPGCNLRRTCCRLGSWVLCRCCHCSRSRQKNRHFRRSREKKKREPVWPIYGLRNTGKTDKDLCSSRNKSKQIPGVGERWQRWVITCVRSNQTGATLVWLAADRHEIKGWQQNGWQSNQQMTRSRKEGGAGISEALLVQTIGHGNQTGMFARSYVLRTVARTSAKHAWLRRGSV